MVNKKRDFNDLRNIVRRLRGEGGCPWDKEQDEKTIKNYLLEETHEIIQAIENDDYENLKEELGDVLFQILFLADISEEKGYFDVYDAITCAYEKFVRRHPHVFDEKDSSTRESLADKNKLSSKDVVKLWDNIKQEEKKPDERDILSGIPKTLPALLRAFKVSKRAEKVGFDWEHESDVINKINEEVLELKDAVDKGDLDHIKEELGDILFSIVNLCRFLRVNPENALNKTTNKFINRFSHVQKRADYDLSKKDINTLESYWEEAKKLKK
jgi:tetrapyrrole methylase family protein/MazG family protein